MGKRTESQTRKVGGTIVPEYFETTIYDKDGPSDNVRGTGNTKSEAREDAEEKWADKERDA